MDLRTEGPLVRDLVDVVLDTATEPLVTAVLRVAQDSLAVEAPVDRGGRLVLPEPRDGGLLVWRGNPWHDCVPTSCPGCIPPFHAQPARHPRWWWRWWWWWWW